jgi:hypothetical protein
MSWATDELRQPSQSFQWLGAHSADNTLVLMVFLFAPLQAAGFRVPRSPEKAWTIRHAFRKEELALAGS